MLKGFEILAYAKTNVVFPSLSAIMNIFQRYFSSTVMTAEYSSMLWHHLQQQGLLTSAH